MPLLQLSVRHDRSLEEARALLEQAVQQVHAQLGALVQRVDWAPDRSSVRISGTGFVIEMRVDPREVHVTGDLPFLAGLLGGPVTASLKRIVEQTFQKQLPDVHRPSGGPTT